MGRLAWVVIVTAVWAATSLAATVTTTIDEAASTMDVEFCIGADCDSDSVPVAGSIEIALDDLGTPQELTLHDFELILLDDVDLRINIVLGHLSSVTRGGEARYAHPGTPYPPSPLSGSEYDLGHVPVTTKGLISYKAVGTMCIAFRSVSLLCEDIIDLAAYGITDMETIGGEVSVEGEDVTLLFEPILKLPFFAHTVGEIILTGHIVGRGTVPSCPVRPGPVSGLRLVETGGGLSLVWDPEPNSTHGYRVYSVGEKLLLPPNGSNLNAVLECETLAPAATSCDATHSGAPLVLYQVVGLCGDGSEGPN